MDSPTQGIRRSVIALSLAGGWILAGLISGLPAGPAKAQDRSAQGRIVDESEELPQGLAIVPWKKTPAGALEEGPVRLVEEPLQAVDPEVFRRQHQLDDQAGSSRPEH